VRSVAGGNETVPTVRVGDVALVNPSPHRLVEQVRAFDPSLIGPSNGPVIADPRRAQWVVLSGLIALSFGVEAIGHTGLSWTIDEIAVLVYVGFRLLRTLLVGRRLWKSSQGP
jgi:hypothetical protein